ncbi:uncharacterized protein PgNI_12389, partial [Pyricularia grisea]|uniref:Uncharacterized protein n=1 Tax=Pyricularia grisea TaxID=148305 RepID=A0A6P8AMW2_PYRGI
PRSRLDITTHRHPPPQKCRRAARGLLTRRVLSSLLIERAQNCDLSATTTFRDLRNLARAVCKSGVISKTAIL